MFSWCDRWISLFLLLASVSIYLSLISLFVYSSIRVAHWHTAESIFPQSSTCTSSVLPQTIPVTDLNLKVPQNCHPSCTGVYPGFDLSLACASRRTYIIQPPAVVSSIDFFLVAAISCAVLIFQGTHQLSIAVNYHMQDTELNKGIFLISGRPILSPTVLVSWASSTGLNGSCCPA